LWSKPTHLTCDAANRQIVTKARSFAQNANDWGALRLTWAIRRRSIFRRWEMGAECIIGHSDQQASWLTR